MLQIVKLFQRQSNGTLICLKSKAPISATTSRLLQDCNPMLPTKIFLLTRMILVTFQDASCFWSSHALFCHASDTICSKDKNHYAFGHAFGQAIRCLAMLLLTQYAPKTRM